LVLYCFVGHTLLFLWAAAPSALKLARARSSALQRRRQRRQQPSHASPETISGNQFFGLTFNTDFV
jgi:hypothetical protein